MEPARFRWSSAALSDVGLVRRVNEDACLESGDVGLWAVADGMGGHDHGDVASSMLVDALAGQPACTDLAACSLAMRNRLQDVNDRLRATATARGVPMIGTTVVALLACEAACTILWAGDSRAYLMRQGRLQQLTQDHRQPAAFAATTPSTSLGAVDRADCAPASVEDMTVFSTSVGSRPVDDHGATRAAWALASGSNVTGSNVITRAVGAGASLVLEEVRLSVEDGDVFLLCSDGLTDMVDDLMIAQALAHGSCRQAAQLLVSLALQRGGTDNVTVVVAAVTDLHSNERTVFNPMT